MSMREREQLIVRRPHRWAFDLYKVSGDLCIVELRHKVLAIDPATNVVYSAGASAADQHPNLMRILR